MPAWALTVKFETPWGTVRTEHIPQHAVYLDHKPDDKELAEMLARQYGDSIKRIVEVRANKQVETVNVYVRRFAHAAVEIPEDDFMRIDGPNYFIYEFVAPDRARLVDDVSRIDYVLYIFTHSQSSRAGCAQIKILHGDAVWQEIKNTCCATDSRAVAMAVVRYGSRLTVAFNKLPYRGCCEEWRVEEWESVFPPRRLSQYYVTEPKAADIKPEEVV